MKKTLATIGLALASAVLLVSCASVTTSGYYQRKASAKIIYVVSDRELDDLTIHNAIIAELQTRGFRVIDSYDRQPANVKGALVLHYLDTWKWDWLVTGLMHLSTLSIRIMDSNSEILATTQFNAPVNSFRSSRSVVTEMFVQLDAKL
jgi:hypothetical protein